MILSATFLPSSGEGGDASFSLLRELLSVVVSPNVGPGVADVTALVYLLRHKHVRSSHEWPALAVGFGAFLVLVLPLTHQLRLRQYTTPSVYVSSKLPSRHSCVAPIAHFLLLLTSIFRSRRWRAVPPPSFYSVPVAWRRCCCGSCDGQTVWALAEALSSRLVPLWVNAHGADFSWDWTLMAVDANIQMVSHLTKSHPSCFAVDVLSVPSARFA